MLIGILDSGIGGLAVARAVADGLPDYGLLYYGDTARAPYGTKGAETARRFALQGARYLRSQGAGLLLIASHTVSAVAAGAIAAELDIPVLESVTPLVRQALAATRKDAIGIVGSPTLIADGAYPRQLKDLRPGVRVAQSPCSLLAPLVEAGWLKRPETARVVKACLRPLKDRQVDTLVLAGGHFVLLQKLFQHKAGMRVRLIAGGALQARHLADYVNARPELDALLEKTGRRRFEVSDLSGLPPRLADTLYGRRLALTAAPAHAWQ